MALFRAFGLDCYFKSLLRLNNKALKRLLQTKALKRLLQTKALKRLLQTKALKRLLQTMLNRYTL
ncbi:MAG: hypothetical protein DRR08_28885 [Candidatus Parabeggiatoa sp. nov. 2]|nr:MAG: hypothetical protein DRR08_28885 [Gammaproteobacteria bacterium]